MSGQEDNGWSTAVNGVKLTSSSSSAYVYVDNQSMSLLEVPNVDPTFNVEEHDFRHMSMRDPLFACSVLQDAGRAELSAEMAVRVEQAVNDSVLSLGITLDISVSLIFPTISEPTLYATKIATSEAEEAQRRAMHYIFPPQVQRSAPQSHMDVASLYATLGPAPQLNPPSLQANYQPHQLLPTLLPFQRRSVAWLLSREGKAINDSLDVVDRNVDSDLPLFWQKVLVKAADGTEQELYVNDLTGAVSTSKPSDDSPRGGILAEEPGLGKTLESIALVLLNPAIGRNPSNKSWNADARIFMKEVKTTLIVTPASLLQQWVDELKLHAPSLKVLIYEGWSKVKVPITESDLAVAKEERAKAARKAKARATRAELAAAKSSPSPALAMARAKGKGKAKAQDDNTTEMDVDDAESRADAPEDDDEELLDWCSYVNQFDVCITTYNVLQQDLGVARPPPNRPRRTNATYVNIERSRSPLVMCEFYRVLMDEVQMVGGGKTEEMVSLIPRVSSFAVSGTPARSQIGDLIQVWKFLRVDAVTPRIWARLLKPGYADQLVQLFLRYAIRTMKASVKDELTIPKQTRYLVPIELGRVERHVYDQNLEKALLDLGLDARGVAVSEGWQVDTANLRNWLRKLRGICTHPQVGQLQNQGDKLHKPGVLKTIGEVLESMKDQNWRNLMEDRRSKVQLMTETAQLYQRHEQHHTRYQTALEILSQAEKEANDVIQEIEATIAAHDQDGRRLKAQATAFVSGQQGVGESSAGPSDDKGKGRAMSEESDDLPRNAAGEEHRVKRRALVARLRECQITLHKVTFLKGDVHHVLGNTEEETAAYEKADGLRRLLLRGTEETAERAMAYLAEEGNRLDEKEMMIEVPYLGAGGIRSSLLMEEVNEKVDELLNQQSALLWKWRTHLVKLLTMPLNSKGEEVDGMEYGRSLDAQGEAETYLQVYAALLADRREALTAERTLLAAHDVREKKSRRTKAAKKAELALMDEDVMLAVGDFEPQPQDEALRKELNDQRKAFLDDHNPERAIRSIMVELSHIAAAIMRKDDPEKIIATQAADQLRNLLASQAKLMEKLQADLNRLRRTFNERIQYFRQLQEVSDTVADIEWEGQIAEAIERNVYETEELDVNVNTGKARQRYLEHLAKSQGEGTMDSDEESCILCKCEFERGYITQCAHVFCEDCMKAWLTRERGKTCPVCRVAIHPDTMQRFVIGDKSAGQAAPPRPVNNEPAPKSTRRIEYNFIDPDIFHDVNTMEALGSYGSKIQTLLRHLLYLQIIDPGAKSIVFSAWADSLLIIEHALTRNAIPCLRIDQSTRKENAVKKFKTDPNIQVLLLHGERENAGLNVTCASRVFLVESVVHHAFEIQAIARIDRMGQTRPTEVFCYYAEDTVERNILDLAARRGQSLYTKDHAAGTLTAGPITAPSKSGIDAPKKRAQKGDFVFKTEDMLAIFFPHLFEDIEYLIPADEQSQTAPQPGSSQASQPIAGPSRLA
ncbi:hypothetical protein PsYK624_052160 [Phanerochaete sordida]|uniref:RING-type domain-containing protein n=1 Tax=Phanerochaete sordida TaxID=48140 RepID=A0A9P3G4R0_9APHY|nr:hypothetical protein PsYK624_052160 [Phanerochaete sordida]